MTTNKLGGYSMVLAVILLFISGIPGIDGTHLSRSLEIFGFTGVIFGVFVWAEHLRNSSSIDNGLLRLIPVLVLLGWTSQLLGSAITSISEHANIETTNAIRMIPASFFLGVGSLGWLGNFLAQYVVLTRPDFNANKLYRILTGITAIASLALAIFTHSMLYLLESIDPATVAGTMGKWNVAGDLDSILVIILLPTLILTTLWAIFTGITLSRK